MGPTPGDASLCGFGQLSVNWCSARVCVCSQTRPRVWVPGVVWAWQVQESPSHRTTLCSPHMQRDEVRCWENFVSAVLRPPHSVRYPVSAAPYASACNPARGEPIAIRTHRLLRLRAANVQPVTERHNRLLLACIHFSSTQQPSGRGGAAVHNHQVRLEDHSVCRRSDGFRGCQG
jgi:hypothetical protein